MDDFTLMHLEKWAIEHISDEWERDQFIDFAEDLIYEDRAWVDRGWIRIYTEFLNQ